MADLQTLAQVVSQHGLPTVLCLVGVTAILGILRSALRHQARDNQEALALIAKQSEGLLETLAHQLSHGDGNGTPGMADVGRQLERLHDRMTVLEARQATTEQRYQEHLEHHAQSGQRHRMVTK